MGRRTEEADLRVSSSPIARLAELGQSVWLDFIQRSFVTSGRLAAMIDEHGLAGMTSNPAIFEKAIGHSDEYDADIARLAADGLDAEGIYQELALTDVRAAADALGDVFQRSGGRDGFVSLEVSPHLAHDTEQSVAQGLALWHALDRPNVMIKIPGTRAGLPAVRELTAAGVNVNVTLLFGLERYREVLNAFMDGLEIRVRDGRSLERIASVASFFVSRVDTAVDRLLGERGAPDELLGRAAVANARRAYQHFLTITETPRWQTLFAGRAKRQRLLWASTGTKNPAYSDVMYVDELIAPHTVNTMPPATLDAYLDHGDPAVRIDEASVARADEAVRRLAEHGVDLEAVAEQLEAEGVAAFVEPYDALLETIEGKRRQLA